MRALAAAGRITVGPWYILMDEFLVSGETIIRNLQKGIVRGSAFGGVMEVGYLPDMFGHVAQMPQILEQAGFGHTVVWRGVPSPVEQTAFIWTAPDGSSVRAEYLVAGYGNGAALPEDAKQLVRRLAAIEEECLSFLPEDGPMLLMNGSDHLRPQPWLGRVVAEANQLQDNFELSISSLGEYLAGTTRDGLVEWRGELRSGFRSNVLMGVASNRVDVKQAAARAERSLERLAEPLSALFLPARPLARPLPRRGLDPDGAQFGPRLDLRLLGRRRRRCRAPPLRRSPPDRRGPDRAGAACRRDLDGEGRPGGREPVGPRTRRMVDVVVPAVGEPVPDVQVLSERGGLPGSITLDGETVRKMLGMLQGARIDDQTYVTDVSLTEDETGLDITMVIGPEPREGVPVEEVKRELFTRLTARPDTEVRLVIDQPPVRRVLARQESVPGFGWGAFAPAPWPTR